MIPQVIFGTVIRDNMSIPAQLGFIKKVSVWLSQYICTSYVLDILFSATTDAKAMASQWLSELDQFAKYERARDAFMTSYTFVRRFKEFEVVITARSCRRYTIIWVSYVHDYARITQVKCPYPYDLIFWRSSHNKIGKMVTGVASGISGGSGFF